MTTTHRDRLHTLAGNSSREWFAITAEDKGARAVVRIFAEIGDSFFGESVSAADFVAQVTALDVDEIDLHINSPGGEVYDAIAIANTIKQHKAKVIVTVDGIAASAASFVAIAGDELIMAPNSELMLHDAWGVSVGNAEDLRSLAARLDSISDNMASMYAAKAGGDLADWREVMQAETWYSAQEAVTAGLADRVLPNKESTKPAAKFDLGIFAHAGRAQAPPPSLIARTPEPPAEPDSTTPPLPTRKAPIMSDLTTGLRERLGITAETEIDDDGLLAAVDEALAERAEAPAASAGPAIPAGTVLVDEAALADLRANADLGVQAHQRQLADDQAALVFAAVEDGRIAPAQRDHWLASLKADPTFADVLASLAPGLVPIKAKGYTGGIEEAPDDDRIYQAAWPTNEVRS